MIQYVLEVSDDLIVDMAMLASLIALTIGVGLLLIAVYLMYREARWIHSCPK